MTTREGRFSDDRLYYRVWDAQAPRATLVLAHGYGEHSGRYEHVGGALANAGFTTWAMDHFGHGQSAGDDRGSIGSLAGAVADLDDCVDVATADPASPPPVFLLGHSMGGLIATAYAEEHQDRLKALVLSGPAVAVNPMLEALQDLDEIPEVSLAPFVSRDPDVVKDYENDPLNYLGPMPRSMIKAMSEITGVRDRLSTITLPVLVMHGDADALVSPQASQDIAATVASKDVTLKLWPGLFHEIYNEPEQAAVIAETISWLEAHLA
ncbi:MAG: alpha/beta hydrolase [Actinobacteria bacterium]|nr:alpha/beta hydrolase [Actinomycetota bacterium]